MEENRLDSSYTGTLTQQENAAMKPLMRFMIAVFVLTSARTLAQDQVREPSTGKSFPARVTFAYSGKDYNLKITGVAVRKKFVFKVYGIAHYMEDAAKLEEADAFKAILTDGKAKQITMDFARDVDPGSIKSAYTDGFKEHSTAQELQKIQPFIDQFLGYFARDVKENEQFILRWLPGGTVLTIIYGEEKPAITNETFARTLWSIWFGEDSIVDRDDLIAKVVGK